MMTFSLRHLTTALLLLLLGLLSACGGEDTTTPEEAGDPIPNVRLGMQAFYSGDLGGVDRYFTDEIVLDAKRSANQAAQGQGGIDLSTVTFEIAGKQAETLWTVRMTGQYSVWLNGQQEWRDTETMGAVLISVKIEDGVWKINGFGNEAPPASTPSESGE